jgi:hypothetical protein
MIHKHSNETQTKWDKGEFQVQLVVAGNPQPIGFCDGTKEDLAELTSMAEAEGSYDVRIEKKALKSGREIWTLGGAG